MTLEFLEIMEKDKKIVPRKREFPRFKEFNNLRDVEFYPQQEEKFEQRERNEKLESLLVEIYGVDPKTNLPVGDVAQYMSDNTNPQIRDFISKQLMSAVEPVGNSSQLSDDDLVRYQRKSGESVRDYVERMANYVRDDVVSYRAAQQKNVEPKTE